MPECVTFEGPDGTENVLTKNPAGYFCFRSAEDAAKVSTAINSHDDLVDELVKAEQIILAMLNAMTLEQKTAVAAKLAADGVSEEGMTRYHERRAALAKAGAA